MEWLIVESQAVCQSSATFFPFSALCAAKKLLTQFVKFTNSVITYMIESPSFDITSPNRTDMPRRLSCNFGHIVDSAICTLLRIMKTLHSNRSRYALPNE